LCPLLCIEHFFQIESDGLPSPVVDHLHRETLAKTSCLYRVCLIYDILKELIPRHGDVIPRHMG